MKNSEAAAYAIRIQQNETGAFEDLYKKLWNTVYYCLYKRLGNQEDATDAAQDVFTDVYAQIGSLRNPNAFNIWLSFLMKRACKKYIRYQRGADADLSVTGNVCDTRAEHQPEAWAEYMEMCDSVRKCVAILPTEQRNVISLRYFEDYPPNQINRITRSSVQRTLANLTQGQIRLRELLEISEVDYGSIARAA